MACREIPFQTLVSAGWLSVMALSAQVCIGSEISSEIYGQVRVENRWYPENAEYPGQSDHASGVVLEPEFYFEDINGWSFNLVPFLRYDSADPRRSHVDLREAYFLLFGEIGNNEWELRLGVDRVFWGVVESNHLVDIINQTDLIEHPDEEVELGQLMAHATWSGDLGIAELFILPHHRERTFSGRKGRLRSSLIVDDEHPSFESGAKEWHIDFAARYSQNFGPFDVGVSFFDGTSRDPLLRPEPSQSYNGSLVLIPHYEQIRQLGVDAQLTTDEWLFKLEIIHRADSQNLRYKEEDYAAFVIGVEYTLYSIFESAVDFGVLAEWCYDERGRDATNIFDDDLLFGARIAFNDIQNTEIFTSLLKDREYSTSAFVIELSRRLSNQWSANLELFSLFNIEKMDTQFDPIRRDSFLEFRLNYNF